MLPGQRAALSPSPAPSVDVDETRRGGGLCLYAASLVLLASRSSQTVTRPWREHEDTPPTLLCLAQRCSDTALRVSHQVFPEIASVPVTEPNPGQASLGWGGVSGGWMSRERFFWTRDAAGRTAEGRGPAKKTRGHRTRHLWDREARWPM